MQSVKQCYFTQILYILNIILYIAVLEIVYLILKPYKDVKQVNYSNTKQECYVFKNSWTYFDNLQFEKYYIGL